MKADNDYEKRLVSFIRRQDNVAIIGLGNEYKMDDGAGIAAIRLLKNDGIGEVEGVTLWEAGRELLSYLPDIEDSNPSGLLFIDAANLGTEPGGIRALNEEQIVEHNISTHENNLAPAVVYIRSTASDCQVLFIGIQFDSLEMSEELSLTKEMEKGVEKVVKIIVDALRG